MLESINEHTQELIKKNQPFALATVVWREAPSSGKVGDKALIDKYGEIFGWVGGGCVKSIIIKEADDAMKSGEGRLVKIGQSMETTNQEGIKEYKMTCQSEGSVEVFIEPVLPLPHLVVMGKTAIAKALVNLAKASRYRVTAVAQDATLQTFGKIDELITQLNLSNVSTTRATFIVIATQGEQDETALMEALKKENLYLGFVASRKKMATLSQWLEDSGVEKEKIAAIKSPAGLDINAKTPEQVAISILAEMIQVQNSLANVSAINEFEASHIEPGVAPKYYINPVCGVPVDINNPKHVIDYKGEKIYFCCDGCKVKFEASPETYISKTVAT